MKNLAIVSKFNSLKYLNYLFSKYEYCLVRGKF